MDVEAAFAEMAELEEAYYQKHPERRDDIYYFDDEPRPSWWT